jgi:methyl-accepting chemotaxis protein
MSTRSYVATGLLLGLCFPILGTAVEILTHHRGLPLLDAALAAQGSPLLWIIDLSPAVLAVAGLLIGRRQVELEGMGVAQRSGLLRTADDLTGAARELLSSASSFSALATETAAAVRETTATMGQMGQTATRAALTAETVIGLAQAARRTADEGSGAVETATAELAQLTGEVEALSRSIEALNERIRAFFEVASSVSAVADRSEALARAAAEELRRAEAPGPGLEALRAEMQQHADLARRTAAEVKASLAEVHKAMLAARTAAEIGVRRAEQGSRVASTTGEAIRRLAGTLRDSSEAAREIATVAQQQDHGIEQVLKAMNGIYLAAQESMASTQRLVGQARVLSDLSVTLKRRVEGLESEVR